MRYFRYARAPSVAVPLFTAAYAFGFAQTVEPINTMPNPYVAVENWAKMPPGRTWGSTSAVDIDPDGSMPLIILVNPPLARGRVSRET